MIAGLSIGGELRRFARTHLGRIAILAIIIVPLFSSALYLFAFWNPFGNVNKLPVAFVNSDQGSTLNGEPFNAGDKIEASLKESSSSSINFDYVDEQTALTGVQNGTYYFMVQLDPGFSKAVTSAQSDDPTQAVIHTIYNDANGYLSTMIGQNVMRTLVPIISEQIGTQSVSTILTGLQNAGTGIIQAADGAQQLADGSQKLHDGLLTAQTGTEKLIQGSATLNTKMGELAQGSDQLLQGAAQLKSGTQQLENSLEPLKAIDVEKLQEQLRSLHLQEADNAAQELQKITDLLDGVSQLNAGMGQLQDGISTLNAGAHQLQEEGTSQLNSGLIELGTGMNTLAQGSAQLADGSEELARKLQEGSSAIPNWTDSQRESVANVIGDPVTQSSVNEAGEGHTFGMGLAPFFMSLGLFMGAMATFMLLRPISLRAVAGGLAPLRATFHGLLPAGIIALFQATVVTLVCVFAVGVRPAHFWLTLLAAMLIAVMNASINQLLIIAVGPGPGRVLAIAFMMLQLLSSGGLYPIETQPAIFQHLHPYDPMTYAVNLLRQTIYGNFDHRLPQAIIAIIGITLVCYLLSSLCARRDRTWTLKRLHPAIEV